MEQMENTVQWELGYIEDFMIGTKRILATPKTKLGPDDYHMTLIGS